METEQHGVHCRDDVIPAVQSLLQWWWIKDCDTQTKPECEPERFLGYFLEKQ